MNKNNPYVTVNSFSCGFSWFYWDSYKSEQSKNRFYFSMDTLPNGYKPYQLYVHKAYSSYKEEILHHLAYHKYHQCITKANKLMSSVKVKKLASQKPDKYLLRFGIPYGTPITSNHILSIILYCDLDRYSTKFSESFRRMTPYEIMYSVRKRNSKYWWQAKLLKETVVYYGELSYKKGAFCMHFHLFYASQILHYPTIIIYSFRA